MTSSSCCETIFSRILEMNGSFEMGLSLFVWVGSRVDFFKIGLMLAVLKPSGTEPEVREWLIMESRLGPRVGRTSLRNFGGITSKGQGDRKVILQSTLRHSESKSYFYIFILPCFFSSLSSLISLSLFSRASLSVSPPEDSLLSSQLPRYRFLPSQSLTRLEERWRGASWGGGPRRDPPQPRWNLPDECWPEPFISHTWRLDEVRLCVSAPWCDGGHHHRTGKRSDQDQLG